MKLTTLTLCIFAAAAPSPLRGQACEVAGGSAGARELDRALLACHTARERFADLFEGPVPEVRVRIWDEPGYRGGVQSGRAVVFWPSERAMASHEARSAEFRADPWREVLPHEIAHVLLAARFYGRHVDGAGESAYGTPFPDWLDEGVAIWAEPAESRRDRLRGARKLPARRRDLRTIVLASHPASGDARVLAMRDGAAPPGNRALWDFYPQSIAVLAFVHEAGGRAAVSELARRLVAGSDAPEALVGLPGLTGDFDAISAAWTSWLETDSAQAVSAR